MKRSALCRKIAEIPGIGPITATAVVAAVGDARQFRNGRHLSAWLGLVPRQYSSGGKPRLHGISRRGDTYMRTLLIHGARAALRYAPTKTDSQSIWLQELMARRGHKCAAAGEAVKRIEAWHRIRRRLTGMRCIGDSMRGSTAWRSHRSGVVSSVAADGRYWASKPTTRRQFSSALASGRPSCSHNT